VDRTSSPELLVSLSRADGPLHAQLEGQLRAAVRDGRLAAGERLPSSRALAAQLGVSRGVVVEAYGQLAAEGYLAVRPGAAPRVAAAAVAPNESVGEATAAPARYDLRPGTPDLSLFPRAAWARAARRALREAPHADLGYPEPAGHPRLRAALAAYLGRVRGVLATPDRIVVCGGVAEALALVARVLRAGGARRIAVEDPSHFETRGLLAHNGLEPVPVRVDARGIDVDALADAAPDAVLITPAHQFPTGVVLDPARRAALLDWARRAGTLVIEDDYDAEYRYDRHPVGALQGLAPDHVVHVHSVSKTLAPGLRMGWAALPARLAPAVREEKRLSDLGAPVLEQLTLAAFLEQGELDRHLRRTRPAYRRRRDVLVGALAGLDVEGVAAGLHVLVRLPGGVTEADVLNAAAAGGIAVDALGPHVALPPRPPALLLGYTRLGEAALARAARLLRSTLDDCHNRRESSA
jgi:GntR family transcriptional regulator / MocR family aminotransferase